MGASDLIQMNCLSGRKLSVRVTSGTRIGWLHFANGSIVHATAGEETGDKAVLEILTWQEGNFEPVSNVTPERQSVETGWQNLLLIAAQMHDEKDRVTVLPIDRNTGPTSGRLPKRVDSMTRTQAPYEKEREVKGNCSRVTIGEDGNITFREGNVEDLIAQGAYAAELAQMIAEALGVERALGLELRDNEGTTVIHLGVEGSIDIVRGTDEGHFVEIRRTIGI
jgi:hypothetical protein